ncbi:hypothetical protein BDR26DRAFT_12736 [Obelidium mucronatum]|nr:hypothetical protein BDR26DRAFT_12736 [Obelidium mucronatum]
MHHLKSTLILRNLNTVMAMRKGGSQDEHEPGGDDDYYSDDDGLDEDEHSYSEEEVEESDDEDEDHCGADDDDDDYEDVDDIDMMYGDQIHLENPDRAISFLNQGSTYISELLESVRWMVTKGEALINAPTKIAPDVKDLLMMLDAERPGKGKPGIEAASTVSRFD